MIGNTLNLLAKNPLVIDVETTISNTGNPFDINNKLVLIQIKTPTESIAFTKNNFFDILPYIKKASVLIGSNFKFDLHWLRKELNYIIDTPIWDLQLAEFIFSNQQWKYPDLNTMCINYGLPEKIHTIDEKYWSKGIDTDQIPIKELIEYGINDVELTYQVFLKQLERFSTTEKSKYKLFRLQCNDAIVLQEMEYNGIVYDEYNSRKKAEELENEINKIDKLLYEITNYKLNYNSNDDISFLLYGGNKTIIEKIPIGFYKTGLKIGQVRFKNEKSIFTFPRLIEPLPKTELAKPGFYSTAMPTLLSLKARGKVKKIIDLLIQRSILEKINGTYLLGLPKKREEMNWPPNKLHSTLNQCVTVTGRLSSTKPNQQNFADLAKSFCISRYE